MNFVGRRMRGGSVMYHAVEDGKTAAMCGTEMTTYDHVLRDGRGAVVHDWHNATIITRGEGDVLCSACYSKCVRAKGSKND